MTTGTTPSPEPRRDSEWRRGIQPLLWWVLLVLVLYAIRTHQRLSEQTRLGLSVSLQGRAVSDEAAATLDDKPAAIGDGVSIGWHTIAIHHPKAESFSINRFIWYRKGDLGEIQLKRAMGGLAVAAQPPAQLLTIRGPEFSRTFTNSPGMTSSVPSDTYSVAAQYAHWEQEDRISVLAGLNNVHRLMPALGGVDVSCNQDGATFELISGDNRLIERGQLPASITDLPAGRYKLSVQHHRSRREQELLIEAGTTKHAGVEFVYGTAILESEPVGATVFQNEGERWGSTPVTLPELAPGAWRFVLQKEGYDPLVVALRIEANQTNSLHTNLVNASYSSAMESARKNVAATNIQAALVAVNEALRVQPGDSEATTLCAELTQKWKLMQAQEQLLKARELAKSGDRPAAILLLDGVLKVIPDNEEVKQLQAEWRRQEVAMEREQRPRKYFQRRMSNTANASLFDAQDLRANGKLVDIEEKLVRAMTNGSPSFKLQVREHPEDETFFVSVSAGMSFGGRRRVDVVGGQTSDGEVTLLFKVFDYALPLESTWRALVGKLEDKDMIPVHESRLGPNEKSLLNRRDVGKVLIYERIRKATGE